MTRERLPNRRGADVITFVHKERRWTATFSRFKDGLLAEIFIDPPKESPLADAVRESAILVSLALQHGCPAETIRNAISGRDASPLSTALSIIGDGSANNQTPKITS